MRHFFTIFSHEIRVLLLSPSTYVAATLFLGLMGFVFQSLLETYSKAAQEVSPSGAFFELFWLPVLFMVPLLTMKTLAEERRSGTLETLLTAPVGAGEVVLGKFFAAYTLYMLLWLSTLAFPALLRSFVSDAHFLDVPAMLGGCSFIAVSGLLYVALGILASSVCRTQAIAGILAFTALFGVIVGVNLLSNNLEFLQRDGMEPVRNFLDSTQAFRHLEDFSRGVVDTRQVVFYITGASLALILSTLGIEAKILRS